MATKTKKLKPKKATIVNGEIITPVGNDGVEHVISVVELLTSAEKAIRAAKRAQEKASALKAQVRAAMEGLGETKLVAGDIVATLNKTEVARINASKVRKILSPTQLNKVTDLGTRTTVQVKKKA